MFSHIFLAAADCPIIEDPTTNLQNIFSIEEYIKNYLSLESFSFLGLFLSFIAGLLSSLSPCIYPLIPITLSILGTKKYKDHYHGFLLALTYVLGMSINYSLLAIAFSLLGIFSSTIFQSQVFLLFFALLFLFLALSIIDIIHVIVPRFLTNMATSLKSSGFKGAFFMGMASGIIAAPCTGPVLAFILSIISFQEGSQVTYGVLLMFSYAFGMGFIFLLLGTFSTMINKLPKSGPWMEKIKYLFASLMLGAFFYYLSLAIGLSLTDLWPKFSILIKVIFLLSLFVLLIFLRPLVKLLLPWAVVAGLLVSLLVSQNFSSDDQSQNDNELNWTVITHEQSSLNNLPTMLLSAKQNCQPVLIDFYADWCTLCKKMEKEVYESTLVKNFLLKENFLLIKIDATKSSDELVKVMDNYNVNGLPSALIIDQYGIYGKDSLLTGFLEKNIFLQKIFHALVTKKSP